VNRLCDVWAAWRFYRLLRGWRRHRLGGHIWVRVDIGPDRPVSVQGRLYYPGGRIGGLEPVRLPDGERVERGAA
jgi:hypothetical protein